MFHTQEQAYFWFGKKEHISKNEIECISVYYDLEEESQPSECHSDYQELFTGIIDSFVILTTGEYDISITGEYLPALSDSRKRIWSKLFKGVPVPEQYDGAVDDCAGFLNSFLPDGEEGKKLLEEVLDELDGLY